MHGMANAIALVRPHLRYSMSPTESKRWLDFQAKGIRPTRFKLKSIVFSNKGIGVPIRFSLNRCELSLMPIPHNERPHENVEGYMPAFICEVVCEQSVFRGGGNFSIRDALDKVLPLLGFDYRLPLSFEQWEEYEGEWLASMGAAGSMSVLNIYGDNPNKNIHAIVEAYEKLSSRTDKRSQKALSVRNRLKEAITLENISRRYSFLSFYNIIEIISDDLAAAKDYSSGDQIAREISEYALSTKGSQRTKIYFLLHAMPNSFEVQDCVHLSDIRNYIAHGEQEVEFEYFELCKKLAYWASEGFALRVANGA